MRKKLISIALSVLIVLSLIGCGQKTDSYTKIYKECIKSDTGYYEKEATLKGTVLDNGPRVLLSTEDDEIIYFSKSNLDYDILDTLEIGDKLIVTSNFTSFIEASANRDGLDYIAMTSITNIKIDE